jgi:hypothetical protein
MVGIKFVLTSCHLHGGPHCPEQPSSCLHLLATSTSTTIILGSLDTPIDDVVVLVAFSNEEVTEELAKV